MAKSEKVRVLLRGNSSNGYQLIRLPTCRQELPRPFVKERFTTPLEARQLAAQANADVVMTWLEA